MSMYIICRLELTEHFIFLRPKQSILYSANAWKTCIKTYPCIKMEENQQGRFFYNHFSAFVAGKKHPFFVLFGAGCHRDSQNTVQKKTKGNFRSQNALIGMQFYRVLLEKC